MIYNTKKAAENSGGVEFSSIKNQHTIDLSNDNELSERIGKKTGSEKYKEIQTYILEILEEQPVTLSDGRNAVVDNSDAQHIARGAGNKKISQISSIKRIVENAKLVAEEKSTKKRKFDYFYYYEATVKFGKDTYQIYLNVGRARNDALYHIYDITQKLRDTAHRINDVGRPVGNAVETVSLNKSISNPDEIVNTEKSNDNSNDTPSGQYSLGSPIQQMRYNVQAYAKHLNRKYQSKADSEAVAKKIKQISVEDNKSQAKQNETREDVFDNNGKNKWEVWTTYIQDKENTIWEAKLKIANSANGEKILYDVYPIEMVGPGRTMPEKPTAVRIPQDNTKSQEKILTLKILTKA